MPKSPKERQREHRARLYAEGKSARGRPKIVTQAQKVTVSRDTPAVTHRDTPKAQSDNEKTNRDTPPIYNSSLSSLPAKPSFSPREDSRGNECEAARGELVLFPGMAETRRFEDGRVSVVPTNAFAQFCAVYPHVIDPVDTEFAFNAALERAPFEDIIAGAQSYADWLKASGCYPKGAFKWLTQDSWKAKLALPKPRIQDLEKLEDAYVRYTPVETVLERDRANGGNQLERLLARRQS